MTAPPHPDGSEDVNDFLLRIRELGERRNKEDEERTKKLEDEILEGRKQRQARRAGTFPPPPWVLGDAFGVELAGVAHTPRPDDMLISWRYRASTIDCRLTDYRLTDLERLTDKRLLIRPTVH